MISLIAVVWFLLTEQLWLLFTRRHSMFEKLAIGVEAHVFNRSTAWYAQIVWLIWRIFGWVAFTGHTEGTLIKGIEKASPTSSLLKNVWLKFFGWKVGAYFRVSEEAARKGYYVGYRPFPDYSTASICMTRCYERKFMMKIGHEDCRFFAVNLDRNEVPLELIGIFPVSDNTIHQAQEF